LFHLAEVNLLLDQRRVTEQKLTELLVAIAQIRHSNPALVVQQISVLNVAQQMTSHTKPFDLIESSEREEFSENHLAHFSNLQQFQHFPVRWYKTILKKKIYINLIANNNSGCTKSLFYLSTPWFVYQTNQ
jgi:hypothetical protein